MLYNPTFDKMLMVLSRKLRKVQRKAQKKSNPFNPDTNVQFPSLDMVR